MRNSATYIIFGTDVSHELNKFRSIELVRSEIREKVVIEEIFSVELLVVRPYSRRFVRRIVLPVPIPFRVLCPRDCPSRYRIDAYSTYQYLNNDQTGRQVPQ